MSNRLHQYTVLIVDDAPENIMILSHLLMPDYTVRAVVSGEKHWKSFSQMILLI